MDGTFQSLQSFWHEILGFYAAFFLFFFIYTEMRFSHEILLQMFKYGVVRINDLIQDILEWESFYLSGRLQKHVCYMLTYLFPLFVIMHHHEPFINFTFLA